MKVLLINPPQDMAPAQRALENLMPPLNLMCLASYLQKAGHEVKILDLYAGPLPKEEILRRIKDFRPFAAGFATYPGGIDEVYALSKEIKALDPSIHIVLGGLYASYLPEVALSRCPADAVVMGEGEAALTELVGALANAHDLSGIPGLCYIKDGLPVRTGVRPIADSLDALPWPAYELIDFDLYRLPPTRAVRHGRVSSILSARGCNYGCSFCSHHYGYNCRVRLRSPEDVIAEMAHVSEKYGVTEFRFEDCTFTADPERVKKICSLIIERELPVVWNCDVRADTASDELFKAMREAGCRRVFLGVESGSQKLLGGLSANKDIRLDQVRNAVKLAKRHGLRMNCSFVLGLPGETRETAAETFKFALELDPDYAMFSVLVPVVGSKLFDTAVKEGKIDVPNYRGAHYLSAYSKNIGIVEMSELKADELVTLMKAFNKKFYARPRYLLKRLLNIESLAEVKYLAWGFAHIFRGGRRVPAGHK